MNRTLILSVAFAALVGAGVAMAQPEAPHHPGMRHAFPGGDMDANHDGWLSRDEAAAAADRIFDELDTNHDGRLTSADHPHDEGFETDGEDVEVQVDGTQDREVRIIRRGHDETSAEAGAPRVERHITVIRNDNDDAEAPEAPEAAMPPMPPRPPHPPMFMMLIANSEEADLNGDGALSREEFRAQHLRFFDASDANGDHRIRFEPPPEPPVPPAPPHPPAPPQPPRHH